MTKVIPLNKGKSTLVDDEDYEMLVSYCYGWYCSKNGYAVMARGKYMHRLIMSDPQDGEIDHIDGDKLNNQKSNLRIVNRSQNNYNAKPRKNASSKFKGVVWIKTRSRWQANIQIDGRVKYLGMFTDEIEAAKAYNEAAIQHHSEYAKLNEV
jgi:hypothetical protein